VLASVVAQRQAAEVRQPEAVRPALESAASWRREAPGAEEGEPAAWLGVAEPEAAAPSKEELAREAEAAEGLEVAMAARAAAPQGAPVRSAEAPVRSAEAPVRSEGAPVPPAAPGREDPLEEAEGQGDPVLRPLMSTARAQRARTPCGVSTAGTTSAASYHAP